MAGPRGAAVDPDLAEIKKLGFLGASPSSDPDLEAVRGLGFLGGTAPEPVEEPPGIVSRVGSAIKSGAQAVGRAAQAILPSPSEPELSPQGTQFTEAGPVLDTQEQATAQGQQAQALQGESGIGLDPTVGLERQRAGVQGARQAVKSALKQPGVGTTLMPGEQAGGWVQPRPSLEEYERAAEDLVGPGPLAKAGAFIARDIGRSAEPLANTLRAAIGIARNTFNTALALPLAAASGYFEGAKPFGLDAEALEKSIEWMVGATGLGTTPFGLKIAAQNAIDYAALPAEVKAATAPRVLGISPIAGEASINAAMRDITKQAHPDILEAKLGRPATAEELAAARATIQGAVEAADAMKEALPKPGRGARTILRDIRERLEATREGKPEPSTREPIYGESPQKSEVDPTSAAKTTEESVAEYVQATTKGYTPEEINKKAQEFREIGQEPLAKAYEEEAVRQGWKPVEETTTGPTLPKKPPATEKATEVAATPPEPTPPPKAEAPAPAEKAAEVPTEPTGLPMPKPGRMATGDQIRNLVHAGSYEEVRQYADWMEKEVKKGGNVRTFPEDLAYLQRTRPEVFSEKSAEPAIPKVVPAKIVTPGEPPMAGEPGPPPSQEVKPVAPEPTAPTPVAETPPPAPGIEAYKALSQPELADAFNRRGNFSGPPKALKVVSGPNQDGDHVVSVYVDRKPTPQETTSLLGPGIEGAGWEKTANGYRVEVVPGNPKRAQQIADSISSRLSTTVGDTAPGAPAVPPVAPTPPPPAMPVEDVALVLSKGDKPTKANLKAAQKLLDDNPGASSQDLLRKALGGIPEAEVPRPPAPGETPPATPVETPPAGEVAPAPKIPLSQEIRDARKGRIKDIGKPTVVPDKASKDEPGPGGRFVDDVQAGGLGVAQDIDEPELRAAAGQLAEEMTDTAAASGRTGGIIKTMTAALRRYADHGLERGVSGGQGVNMDDLKAKILKVVQERRHYDQLAAEDQAKTTRDVQGVNDLMDWFDQQGKELQAGGGEAPGEGVTISTAGPTPAALEAMARGIENRMGDVVLRVARATAGGGPADPADLQAARELAGHAESLMKSAPPGETKRTLERVAEYGRALGGEEPAQDVNAEVEKSRILPPEGELSRRTGAAPPPPPAGPVAGGPPPPPPPGPREPFQPEGIAPSQENVLKRALKRTVTQIFDNVAPLGYLKKAASGGEAVAPGKDPEALATALRGLGGKTQAWLEDGPVKWGTGEIEHDKPSFADAMSPILEGHGTTPWQRWRGAFSQTPREEGMAEVLSKQRIMKRVQDLTKRPVKFGGRQLRGEQAGSFNPRTDLTRVRRASDLSTAMHEVNHFLFKYDLIDPAGFEGDLERIATPGSNPAEEGAGEWLERYVTDPASAEAAVPGYGAEFERQLGNTWPEMLGRLQEAQNSYRTFRTAPVLNRVMANVVVQPGGEWYREFDALRIMRRALELNGSETEAHQKEAKALFRMFEASPEDLRAEVDRLEATHPEYVRAQEDLRVWRDALLDWVKDSGFYNEEAIEGLKAFRDYAGLQRYFDEPRTSGLGKAGVYANQPLPFKSIRGSERMIQSPTETDIKNLKSIIGSVEANAVADAAATMVEEYEREHGVGLSHLMYQEKRPMKPTTLALKEIAEPISTMLGRPMTAEEKSTLATIFRPAEGLSEGQLHIWRKGGEKQIWNVEPMLRQALLGSPHIILPDIMIPAIIAAQVARVGFLFHPTTFFTMLAADQMNVAMQTKSVPLWTWAKGLFHLLKADGTFADFRASGASIFHMEPRGPAATRRRLEGAIRGRKNILYEFDPMRPGDMVRALYEGALGLAQYIHVPTRVGVFADEQARLAAQAGPGENGRSQTVGAAVASRQAGPDYGARGASEALRAWGSITAFLQEGIQGPYRWAKTWQRNPGRTAVLTGSFFASTLALYLWGRQFKAYRDTPDDEHDTNMTLAIPSEDGNGKLLKIPIRWQWAWQNYVLPLRIMRWIDTHDPDAFRKLAQSFGHAFAPNPIPSVVRPESEIAANKRAPSNTPLLPDKVRALMPEDQYGPQTSELAKKLGRWIPGHPSPTVIDYLVRGHLGRSGIDLVHALDSHLAEQGHGEPPTIPFEDRMIVRNFVSRFPGHRSKTIDDFYSTLREATEGRASYNLAKSQQHIDRAVEIAQTETWRILAAPAMEQTAVGLRNLAKAAEAIRQNPSISPDDKLARRDALRKSAIQIAETRLGGILRMRAALGSLPAPARQSAVQQAAQPQAAPAER